MPMSAISWSLDTAAKRWLALLALVFVVSVGVLVHSFLDALSPQEQKADVAQPRASVVLEPVHVRTEPAWNSPQPVETVKQSPVGERVSPFDTQPATVRRKADPVVHQQMVHQQADYLRNLIAAGRLPKGLGNLTKEKVDEMEKKGDLIN